MKKIFLSLAAAGVLVLSACGGGDKKDTVEATEAEEVATVGAEAEEYVVDTISTVNWRAYRFYEGSDEDTGHTGFFFVKNGKVMVENDSLVGGEFVVDVNSVTNTDMEDAEKRTQLENHLREADFLDVAKYPEATFVITSVESLADDEAFNSLIKGNLKLREDEKNIGIKANVSMEDGVLTIASEEFNIMRKDFGVNFEKEGMLLKNEVTLQVNVKANKAEAVAEEESTEETVEEVADSTAQAA